MKKFLSGFGLCQRLNDDNEAKVFIAVVLLWQLTRTKRVRSDFLHTSRITHPSSLYTKRWKKMT